MSSNLLANVRKPEPNQQWQSMSKLSPSRLQALGSSGWGASDPKDQVGGKSELLSEKQYIVKGRQPIRKEM